MCRLYITLLFERLCKFICLLTARKPSVGQQLTEDLERMSADFDQLERQLTGMLQDVLPGDVSQADALVVTYKVLHVLLLC